ncbi:MAG: hypothetical protein ACJ8G3_22380 [Burkholderiaceae bacterium]
MLNLEGSIINICRFILSTLATPEFLDEIYLATRRLPGAFLDRTFVRSIAPRIACETHALNNLRVSKYTIEGTG